MMTLKSIFYLLFIFLLFTNTLFSQNKVGLQISLPETAGSSFFSNYEGEIGFGAEYKIQSNERLHYLASIDHSRYELQLFNIGTIASVTKFRIGADYELYGNDKFSLNPVIKFGYALFSYSNDEFDFEQNNNAINVSIGLKFLLPLNESLSFGVFSQYDFSYLELSENAKDSPFNREAHAYITGIQFYYTL